MFFLDNKRDIAYNFNQSVSKRPHEGVHHHGCNSFVVVFFLSYRKYRVTVKC